MCVGDSNTNSSKTSSVEMFNQQHFSFLLPPFLFLFFVAADINNNSYSRCTNIKLLSFVNNQCMHNSAGTGSGFQLTGSQSQRTADTVLKPPWVFEDLKLNLFCTHICIWIIVDWP